MYTHTYIDAYKYTYIHTQLCRCCRSPHSAISPAASSLSMCLSTARRRQKPASRRFRCRSSSWRSPDLGEPDLEVDEISEGLAAGALINLHIYTCVYIYTYVHIHISTCAYIHIHIYIYIYICMYERIPTCRPPVTGLVEAIPAGFRAWL